MTGSDEGFPAEEQNPPPQVVEAALAAFSSRRGGDLATIVFDSLVDADGTPEDHMLRFEYGEGRLELRVSYRAQNTRLRGRLRGWSRSRVLLHMEGVELAIVTDVDDDRFELTAAGHGLVKLALEGPSRSPVWTDWFRI